MDGEHATAMNREAHQYSLYSSPAFRHGESSPIQNSMNTRVSLIASVFVSGFKKESPKSFPRRTAN